MCYHSGMNFSLMSRALCVWYAQHARDFCFRQDTTPYRVWVSEVMLQQTRAASVVPYFERFMSRFPTVEDLAAADQQSLYQVWEGLGYYARARNLQAAARHIVREGFPTTVEGLLSLPGVGAYTARSIGAIAFGLPCLGVDGNLMRIFARLTCEPGDLRAPATQKILFEFGQQLAAHCPDTSAVNQALMDIGATLCLPGHPKCPECPLRPWCGAEATGRQGELPVITPKPAPVDTALEVLIVTNGPTVLVATRPPEGLLAGLTEFPNAPREDERLDEDYLRGLLARDYGITAVCQQQLGQAKHTFTHRRWHMRGSLWVCQSGALTQGQWADAATLQALPIPRAFEHWRQTALGLITPPTH